MSAYQVVIHVIADGLMIPVVLIGLYELIFKVPSGTARYAAYCRILMAGLTAYLIASLASIYSPSEARPFLEQGAAAGALYLNNPGFPSDHTLFAAAITAAVWFETRQKWATWLLIALTVAIAVGRVLALVHTVPDVVFGIIFALVGALWYLNAPERKRRAE
jgi:undecaprenyl-diphosphatase